MEPNDLKSTPPDDAHLEAWLRANASLPPLPDDGFSSRVLTALPPPKRRVPTRLIAAIAGALAGAAVVAQPLFTAGHPLDRLPALDSALLNICDQLTNPGLGIALGVTLASLVFVFWRDLRRFVRL